MIIRSRFMRATFLSSVLILSVVCSGIKAQTIMADGKPAQLDIRVAGENSLRVTLKPISFREDFPYTPALAEKKYAAPLISLRTINQPVRKKIGRLNVVVAPNPVSITVTNAAGKLVQQITLKDDGRLAFQMSDAPVLGLGEGGPKPVAGKNWRMQQVQFDRRGSYDSMQPRWQADAYGSRNPVPMVIGTEGWGIFVSAPWVHVDLREDNAGYFIPWQPSGNEHIPQNVRNQGLNQGKGLPPIDKIVKGLYDFFVFDAHDPSHLMKDISMICGAAAMPPKWALGYMQSHRTLESDKQMIGIVDSFRKKQIPVDAVIYLGTGFTPKGWNTRQPSFEFNPEVFKTDPKSFLTDMHNRNVKVVMHMVPWDRDKLPGLQGNIPARSGESIDASHLQNYWSQHLPLVRSGVDAFWPDEGDWFNLYERLKRHQLYYQGHLFTEPNERPWALHRNGFLGIAQWGGWVWSGDPESSWKTLEAQIAVGINHSLSLSPFWGSDIGGFRASEELTGELYARWFQFGSFNASFRSHGQTWWTRLPWGWGSDNMGPKEGRENPLQSEMSNKSIEPIAKKYAELHYQLLPYTYTLAWDARERGMPPMRALWLHYPTDAQAVKIGDQFLWGPDLLIAPVYEKAATSRKVYLPKGDWYDWWTNTKETGNNTVTRKVDLATMPIYVRAGAIIPFDPVRQFTSELINEATTIKIFGGADGAYTLYEDDGLSMDYLKNKFALTQFDWKDTGKKLTIKPGKRNASPMVEQRIFKIQLLPQGTIKEINYSGKPLTVTF